jgi:hypothetical protein
MQMATFESANLLEHSRCLNLQKSKDFMIYFDNPIIRLWALYRLNPKLILTIGMGQAHSALY